MKNLNKFGVHGMNTQELKKVDGGSLLGCIALCSLAYWGGRKLYDLLF